METEREFKDRMIKMWQQREEDERKINAALAGGPNAFTNVIGLVLLAIIFLLMRSL